MSDERVRYDVSDERVRYGPLPYSPEPEVEELPIPVVPDWNEQVKRANKLCRLIDRHLDYEAGSRILRDLNDFRPRHLCPEQRVQMVTDLHAIASETQE